MSPSGMEPATFRFVAQHFNHCATVASEVYKLPVTIFRWSTASRPFQPWNKLYTLPGEG